MSSVTDEAPTVAQALESMPGLADLLRPLPPEARLTWPVLEAHAAPGRPPDRLAACVIILSALRPRQG